MSKNLIYFVAFAAKNFTIEKARRSLSRLSAAYLRFLLCRVLGQARELFIGTRYAHDIVVVI